MCESHIAGGFVVDIGHFLDGFEDSAVVFRNVCDFGHRETGASAADAAPGGTAFSVAKHHFLACLRKITEQTTTGDTATGHKHIAFHFLGGFPVNICHKLRRFLARAKLANVELGRERAARGGVAHNLHAMACQQQFHTRNTAFATARTHTDTGDVLQLVHRNYLFALHGRQNGFNLDIVAVTDECGILFVLSNFLPIQRFGISVFQDEASDFQHGLAFHIQRFHAGDIGLVFTLCNLLNHAFTHLLAIIVHEIHLSIFLCIVLKRQEQPVFGYVVTKQGQARTVVHALHTTDALVVIDLRHRVGGNLGDSALWAGKRTRVTSESVQAIGHHEWFVQALTRWSVRFVEHAHRMLL